jgi:hypothetical protein
MVLIQSLKEPQISLEYSPTADKHVLIIEWCGFTLAVWEDGIVDAIEGNLQVLKYGDETL